MPCEALLLIYVDKLEHSQGCCNNIPVYLDQHILSTRVIQHQVSEKSHFRPCERSPVAPLAPPRWHHHDGVTTMVSPRWHHQSVGSSSTRDRGHLRVPSPLPAGKPPLLIAEMKSTAPTAATKELECSSSAPDRCH